MEYLKNIYFTSEKSNIIVVAEIKDLTGKIISSRNINKKDIVTLFGSLFFSKEYICQLQLETAYFWANTTIEKIIVKEKHGIIL